MHVFAILFVILKNTWVLDNMCMYSDINTLMKNYATVKMCLYIMK